LFFINFRAVAPISTKFGMISEEIPGKALDN
jgi:hypothetical protein